MEKKYYIIPTIKVKEMEVEDLMAGLSIDKNTENVSIENGNEIQSKPMYNDFNVWEK